MFEHVARLLILTLDGEEHGEAQQRRHTVLVLLVDAFKEAEGARRLAAHPALALGLAGRRRAPATATPLLLHEHVGQLELAVEDPYADGPGVLRRSRRAAPAPTFRPVGLVAARVGRECVKFRFFFNKYLATDV